MLCYLKTGYVVNLCFFDFEHVGDSSSAPGGRGLSELRNRIHQFLRPLSRREHVQVGSSEPQVAANPSATASTERNEAVANAQAEPATGTDEGNFISSVLQQIMPFISQNVPTSSSDEAAGRGSNSSRQASSREVLVISIVSPFNMLHVYLFPWKSMQHVIELGNSCWRVIFELLAVYI